MLLNKLNKMKNSIKLLEKEVKEIQILMKKNMIKCGTYPEKLSLLIGEHLTAIDKLKSAKNTNLF